jgi:hypothetical protein
MVACWVVLSQRLHVKLAALDERGGRCDVRVGGRRGTCLEARCGNIHRGDKEVIRAI